MNTHLKVINERVKKLRETAQEIKKKFEELNDGVLQDLYLEIQHYCDVIEIRIRLLNKQWRKYGK